MFSPLFLNRAWPVWKETINRFWLCLPGLSVQPRQSSWEAGMQLVDLREAITCPVKKGRQKFNILAGSLLCFVLRTVRWKAEKTRQAWRRNMLEILACWRNRLKSNTCLGFFCFAHYYFYPAFHPNGNANPLLSISSRPGHPHDNPER